MDDAQRFTTFPFFTPYLKGLHTLAPLCADGGLLDKSNIIFIVADDMGYADCSCFGSELIMTPHIDALASDGIRFTDFHSNGAVCSPTRAAFLTGRYQQRCGIEGVITAANHRHIGLPLNETTWADVVRSHGYRTGIFGKWHLGYETQFNPTKLVLGGRDGAERELFDLQSDLSENVNLVVVHIDIAEDLEASLAAWEDVVSIGEKLT